MKSVHLTLSVLAIIALAACATPRAQRVSCSGRLQPINAPASSTKGASPAVPVPPASKDTPQPQEDGTR